MKKADRIFLFLTLLGVMFYDPTLPWWDGANLFYEAWVIVAGVIFMTD